eukprot:PRCOL_00005445-RA
MTERSTGKSRGFGFVTYKDEETAERVASEEHEVDGRAVEVKKAVPRGELRSAREGEGGSPGRGATARIFVARIRSSVTDADFRTYFEQFGPISDAYMPKDHVTREHRGIGFITYDSPGPVEIVMARTHELDGQVVAVDRATPKDESHGGRGRSGAGGSGGGRRGSGRGGNPNAMLQGFARMNLGYGIPAAPYMQGGMPNPHYGFSSGVVNPQGYPPNYPNYNAAVLGQHPMGGPVGGMAHLNAGAQTGGQPHQEMHPPSHTEGAMSPYQQQLDRARAALEGDDETDPWAAATQQQSSPRTTSPYTT